MKIKILLTFIFFFLNLSAFATNIRVIDFQSIIDNNTNLDLLYDQIDKDQISHKKVGRKCVVILATIYGFKNFQGNFGEKEFS